MVWEELLLFGDLFSKSIFTVFEQRLRTKGRLPRFIIPILRGSLSWKIIFRIVGSHQSLEFIQ